MMMIDPSLPSGPRPYKVGEKIIRAGTEYEVQQNGSWKRLTPKRSAKSQRKKNRK